MSYSTYQLNQKINNLQNQINNNSESQSLSDVMTIGNTAPIDLNMNSNSITNINNVYTYNLEPRNTTDQMKIGSDLLQGTTIGQIPLAIGSNITDYPLVGIKIGGTLTNIKLFGPTNLSSSVTLGGPLTVVSSTGTTDQYLASRGSAVSPVWKTLPLSGATYIGYTASATLPTTPNPTLFVIFSGSTVSQTLTIPPLAYTVGQIIQFKNRASVNVSISSGLSSMFLYGVSTPATSYTLIPEDTFNLLWNGFAYIQYTPSNTFTKLFSPVINPIVDTLAGSTALTIGSNVFLGNINIGNETAFNGVINIGAGSISPNTPNILIGANNTTLQLVKGFTFYRDITGGLGLYKSYLDVDDVRTSLYLGNNITTGSLRLGSSMTLGDIYIGEAQTAGGIVFIGSVNSETTINGTTKLIGPLNVNSSTGTTDQYLASQGTSTPIWKTLPASTWVGTATSNLNMDTFNIRCNTYRSQSATTQLTIGDNLTTTGSAFDVMLGIGTGITGTSAVGIAIGGASTNTRIYGPAVISGALTLSNSLSASGGITATTGNIITSSGNITSSGTLTAGSTITAGTGITATTGDIITSSGNITSSGTITAGTGITVSSGNITVSSGGITASGIITGTTSVNTPTINPLSNTGNLSLGSSQTTGVINIGIGSRTKSLGTAEGNINIGTGLNSLVSGSVSPTINIGNNTTVGNTTEISIGASATKTTINGPLTLTGTTTATSISGSGTFTTSSNITTTGTGDIQSAGKVKTASLDAVADTATNTVALTIGSNIVNGNIVIGSALGMGDIAIAGAHIAGGTITVGTTSTQTTINGLVKVTSPSIANPGSTPSPQVATNTTLYGGLMWSSVNANYTIPSNINREFFMVIQGVTRTITLPALTIHQIINIKVLSASSMNITAPVAGTQIYPKTGGNFATTYSMPGDSTHTFYCDGSSWFGY